MFVSAQPLLTNSKEKDLKANGYGGEGSFLEETEDVVAILVALKSHSIAFDLDRKRHLESENSDSTLKKKHSTGDKPSDEDHDSEDVWDEESEDENSEEWLDNLGDKKNLLGDATESSSKNDPSPRKKAPSGTACEKHKRWKKRCPEDCPNRKQPKKGARPQFTKSWSDGELKRCFELLVEADDADTGINEFDFKMNLDKALKLLIKKLQTGGPKFAKPKNKQEHKNFLSHATRYLRSEEIPSPVVEDIKRRWLETHQLVPSRQKSADFSKTMRDSSMSPPLSGSEGDSKYALNSPSEDGDEEDQERKPKIPRASLY